MTDHDTRHADGRREEARFTPDDGVMVIFEANINIDDHGDDCHKYQCEFLDRWAPENGMRQLTAESVMFMRHGDKELIEALPLIKPFIEASLPHTNLIVWFALDNGMGEEVVQCDDDPLLFKFQHNPAEWYTEPDEDFEYWLDYTCPEPIMWECINLGEYPDHEEVDF